MDALCVRELRWRLSGAYLRVDPHPPLVLTTDSRICLRLGLLLASTTLLPRNASKAGLLRAVSLMASGLDGSLVCVDVPEPIAW